MNRPLARDVNMEKTGFQAWTDRLERLLEGDDRDPEEHRRFIELMGLFAQLPMPPDPLGLLRRYGELKEAFLESIERGEPEIIEESFLTLYCHVHGHEAPYTKKERRRVDETGGYWCHAGGLSPILRAGPFIRPDTVSADFGAGNGLQGLLLQKLYPHQKTLQIEISSRMVEAGKHLQGWLDIPEDRVEWIVGDVMDASCRGIDFIYMYRPVRPEGEGKGFYEKIAADLSGADGPVVIFSIADCLGAFLPADFERFYTDGHLTCFRKS